MKLVSRSLTLFIFSILILGFSSCKKIDASKGEKKWFTPAVNSSFNGIEFAISGNIEYNAAPTTSIEIYTTEKVYNAIEFIVENNTLKIQMKKGYSIKNGSSIQVKIYAPDVRNFINSGSGSFSAYTDPQSNFANSKVVLSGSGEVYVDQLNSDSQELTLSGSGSLEVNNLVCTESTISLSGSGDIAVSGQTLNSDITISSSGKIEGFNFLSDISDVLISGSGNAEVNADSLLNVLISGSGSVYYKGYPAVSFSGSGSGNIVNAN